MLLLCLLRGLIPTKSLYLLPTNLKSIDFRHILSQVEVKLIDAGTLTLFFFLAERPNFRLEIANHRVAKVTRYYWITTF